MRVLKSVAGIKNPYAQRILSHLIGRDPFRVYCATPAALERTLRGRSARELRLTTKDRAWSIAQILHHLADAEVTAGFRFRMALAHSGTPLQPFDEKRWAKNLRYGSADPFAKLALFRALRADHAAMLRRLTASEWQRYGMHGERGKETVERMMQMMAGHDLNHVRQIRTLVAASRAKVAR